MSDDTFDVDGLILEVLEDLIEGAKKVPEWNFMKYISKVTIEGKAVSLYVDVDKEWWKGYLDVSRD